MRAALGIAIAVAVAVGGAQRAAAADPRADGAHVASVTAADTGASDVWTLSATLTGSQSWTSGDSSDGEHITGSLSASWNVSGDVGYGQNDQATSLSGAGAASEHVVDVVNTPAVDNDCGTQSTDTYDGQLDTGTASVDVLTGQTDPPPDGSEHGQFRYSFVIQPPGLDGGSATDTTTWADTTPASDGGICSPLPPDTTTPESLSVSDAFCGDMACQGDIGTDDTSISHSYSYDGDLGWRYTFQYTLTVSGCAGPGATAAGSGPRLSAADGGSCITITSPPKDAKIALTDPKYVEPYHSHPLADNERAPEAKSLLVQGTVSCGCSVTVNGVAATVSGQQWTATLPNVKPGSLTITAEGSGGSATQADTLVDLRITSPAENSSLPVTAQPAMPDIAATAEAIGLGATPGSLKWTLKAYGEYITTSKGSWEPKTGVIATGTSSGSGPWHPSYSVSAGGYARLQVEATLPGVLDNPVTSDPRWFQIPGTNPGKAAVVAYLKANAAATYNVQSHLVCVESGYRQFDGSAGASEPSMAGKQIPKKGFDDPAPGRPTYGPPSGFGVSQVDPSPDWPADFWNWQDNAKAGIGVYGVKDTQSKSSVTATMTAQQKQLAAVLKQAKAGAGVSQTAPLPGGDPVDKTPDLTADQHVIDIIRRYNGGKQYKFDGKYVLGADGHSVHFIGSGQWILNSASWIDPGYVSAVEHCAAAGAPLDLKDDAKSTPSTKDTTIVVITPAGQHSVVTGSGFTAGIAVHLTLEPSGTSLRITHASKSGQITATVTIPAGTKPGRYVIKATDGMASQARSIPLIVIPAPPVVAKVTPAKGKTAGGTTVTVTGSGFSHVSQVLFGSTPGTKVHVISATKLTVVIPRHAAGLVDVRVVAKSGSTTLVSVPRSTDHFTYTT